MGWVFFLCPLSRMLFGYSGEELAPPLPRGFAASSATSAPLGDNQKNEHKFEKKYNNNITT